MALMAEDKSSEIVPAQQMALMQGSQQLIERGLRDIMAPPPRRPILVIDQVNNRGVAQLIRKTLEVEGHLVDLDRIDDTRDPRLLKAATRRDYAVLILLSWFYWHFFGDQLSRIKTLKTFILSYNIRLNSMGMKPFPAALWAKEQAYRATCTSEFILAVNQLASGQDLPRPSAGLFLPEERKISSAISEHLPPARIWSSRKLSGLDPEFVQRGVTFEGWPLEQIGLVIMTNKMWDVVGAQLSTRTELKSLVILSDECATDLDSLPAMPTSWITMSEGFDRRPTTPPAWFDVNKDSQSNEDNFELVATDALIARIRLLAGDTNSTESADSSSPSSVEV